MDGACWWGWADLKPECDLTRRSVHSLPSPTTTSASRFLGKEIITSCPKGYRSRSCTSHVPPGPNSHDALAPLPPVPNFGRFQTAQRRRSHVSDSPPNMIRDEQFLRLPIHVITAIALCGAVTICIDVYKSRPTSHHELLQQLDSHRGSTTSTFLSSFLSFLTSSFFPAGWAILNL